MVELEISEITHSFDSFRSVPTVDFLQQLIAGSIRLRRVSCKPGGTEPATQPMIIYIHLNTRGIHAWHIYLHEWLIFMVNVGKYTLHGWYTMVWDIIIPFPSCLIFGSKLKNEIWLVWTLMLGLENTLAATTCHNLSKRNQCQQTRR